LSFDWVVGDELFVRSLFLPLRRFCLKFYVRDCSRCPLMERMRLMKSLKKAWKTVMDLPRAAFVLPLAMLLAQTASAGMIYEGETGTRSYLSTDSTKTMYVNIRFSVYDNLLGDFYATAPGPQRYIYQYIVENMGSSEAAVDLFSVVAGPTAGIAAVGTAPKAGGIDAAATISAEPGVKQSADFAFQQTPLSAGKNSYILMYTSNNSFRKDGRAIVTGGGDGSIPRPDGQEVPEPLTALTLGLGGFAIVRRKMMSR
jgi:hypothetical protein